MHREALDTLPELLAQLGVANPILVGHSDGASICLIHAGAGKWCVRGVAVAGAGGRDAAWVAAINARAPAPDLTLFLRVPGAPLDNNACEQALKKAVLHRNNALFYTSAKGAQVGRLLHEPDSHLRARAGQSVRLPQRAANQRRLRETLGRERDRIDKVWLVTDDAPVQTPLRAAVTAGVPVQLLRAPAAALARWLEPAPGQALEDHLYLVDPMGEWVMRWPVPPEPARVKADLERLLRASASWDQPGR